MQSIPASFRQALADLRLEFPEALLEKLQVYLDALLEKNQHMNLTAVREWDEAWMRHILDSLMLVSSLPETGRFLDVGTGGGLPGIPVAIVRPTLEVTLLEATTKKCRFLEEVTAALALTNVKVLNARAETAGRDPSLRETFDVCTARAVGALPVLLEITLPFLKVGGHLVAMKGSQAEEEAATSGHALNCLGGGKPVIRRFQHAALPGACLVRVPKVKPTPPGYPRAPGKPSSEPLR